MLAIVTAGPDEPGCQLEGRGNADRLDGDVRSESVGQFLDYRRPASSRLLFTTMSAPNCLAASSRVSARSMATTCAGAEEPRCP